MVDIKHSFRVSIVILQFRCERGHSFASLRELAAPMTTSSFPKRLWILTPEVARPWQQISHTSALTDIDRPGRDAHPNVQVQFSPECMSLTFHKHKANCNKSPTPSIVEYPDHAQLLSPLTAQCACP